MSVEVDTGIPIFIDPQSRRESAAIALMSDDEFLWAQIVIPDLASHFCYQDWLDCRGGFEVGLAAAGVDVKMVTVGLPPFLAWCRLTRTQPSERALDGFASMLLILRAAPHSAPLAVVSEREFENYGRLVEAFAAHVDYEMWINHREKVRHALSMTGARIHELPIYVGDFIKWSECLGAETTEASLDTYAKLLLEFLIEDAGP